MATQSLDPFYADGAVDDVESAHQGSDVADSFSKDNGKTDVVTATTDPPVAQHTFDVVEKAGVNGDKTAKNKGGVLARLMWKNAEKERKRKMSKIPNRRTAKGKLFSGTAGDAVKTAAGKEVKPPIDKKRNSKINVSTLIVLDAISDGEYDHLVSQEQKFQIQLNSEIRKKLLSRYEKFRNLKIKHKFFYKIFKPRWYRLEKRCVGFLVENEIEVDVLAVTICLDEMRLSAAPVVVSPTPLTEEKETRSTPLTEEKETRSFSSLSGGSGRSGSPDSGSSPDSDSDGSYQSSVAPSPFPSDDEDIENGEAEDQEKVSENEAAAAEKSKSISSQSDSDEQAERPFEYKNIDPQRTSTKPGVFSLNCTKRLSTQQYKNILRQAAENPDVVHSEFPMMFPEPGTLLLFNVEKTKRRWDLKDHSMAQSEVRADGWSWMKSTGASRREGTLDDPMPVVVDHFRGRNKYDGEPEKDLPFDLWQYTTVDNKWQLLHYLGSTDNIAAGYPHGNSVKNIPISRSTRSNIQRLIKNSVDQKPTDVLSNYWRDMDEEVARDPQLSLVTGPRNAKQVQNARQQALNQSRLSTNTIDNISTIGLRLRFPGYYLKTGPNAYSASPRSFIDVLGLTETNLYVYCENPLLFEEMGNVIRESGQVMKIFYDTKFLMGDYFLSVLSWQHPFFENQVILAAYIHDDKGHVKHEDFFRRIWKNNETYLEKGKFVLVTDGEFRLSGVWPHLINLYCFSHLKENMKRRLKGRGRIYKDFCVQLLNELQKEESKEDYLRKLQNCLDLIDNEKVAKIFKYYGTKMLKRCSRYKIMKSKLPDETLTTDRAESMNALIGRYKHKGKLFPDQLIVILFFITQDQYGKIKKGYYGVPSGYVLVNDHIDKALGEPRQMPELPYVPAMTDIIPYIKDKSSLPLMAGMQRTGPLIKRQGESNSNTLNAMAQDLVLKHRVTQNPTDERLFQVLDLGDNYHAIQLKDRDLSKQNYRCSCSAKDCVHVRAVFLYLNIPPEDIPFIASKDPLQMLKRQRNKNKNQSAAGSKKPRKGEAFKEYRSDEDDQDDEGNNGDNEFDYSHMHPPEASRKTQRSKNSADVHLEDGNVRNLPPPSQRNRRRDESARNRSTSLDETSKEKNREILSKVRAQERELRAELRKKYESYKNIYTPPNLLITPPEWWNEVANSLEQILFHSDIYKPDFFNPLPVIPEGKALIFVTADGFFAVCYRGTGNKLTVYSMDNTLPENTPEELSFSAAHCARDDGNEEAVVTVFSSDDNITGKHPLISAALKLMILDDEYEPERFKFDLTDITEVNYHELLQVFNDKTDTNAASFLNKKRQKFYCCCRRTHFDATERRNKYLKIPDMVQCCTCKKHYFACCVNYLADRRSTKKWYCYDCTAEQLPELPSWGQGGENTCTLDNVLTGCVLMYKKHKQFINLIGDTSTFESELKVFLTHMGTTYNTINTAKRAFINAVYDNRNLYGSEDVVVFDRLLQVCGVSNTFTCPTCTTSTRREFFRKTFIGDNTIGATVKETIENVFNLVNVVISNTKCSNNIDGESCNTDLVVSEVQYAQEFPWIIPIGLANEAVNRNFGFKELEQLPVKVEYKGREYQIGGVTFNRKNHFVSILPVEGGWAYYDGLSRDHPVASLSQSLTHVVTKSSVISTIFYFLIPENQPSQKQSKK